MRFAQRCVLEYDAVLPGNFNRLFGEICSILLQGSCTTNYLYYIRKYILHEDLCIFITISRYIIRRMRLDKSCREN
jgi:hypothetical protein